MRIIPRCSSWIMRHAVVSQFLFLGILVAGLATWMQWTPSFVDGDPIHHVRMAQLLRDGFDPQTFLWLPHTTLAERFADQHLLFHVLLIPFVTLMDPFIGMKVLNGLLVVVMVLTFFLLARQLSSLQRLPWIPWIATLSLLSTTPFFYRMNLGKAVVLELTFFFLLILILDSSRHSRESGNPARDVWTPAFAGVTKKYEFRYFMSIVALTFLATWAHGSWPLVVFFVALWILVHGWEQHWPLAFGSALGAVAGLVLHPSFPNTFLFFWDQTVRIALGSVVFPKGGGEWFATAVPDLVSSAPLVIVAVIALPCLFAVGLSTQSITRRSFAFLGMATLLSFLTLRSSRHIEFAAPFLILACAALCADMPRFFWNRCRGVFTPRMLRFVVVPAALCLLVLGIFRTGTMLRQSRSFSYLEPVATWTRGHVPPGTFLVTSTWDAFPNLVYWNDTLRYTSGLDPRFYAFARPDEYRAWIALITDEQVLPSTALRETFHSDYLLVLSSAASLLTRANNDAELEVLYEDHDAAVFRLKHGSL